MRRSPAELSSTLPMKGASRSAMRQLAGDATLSKLRALRCATFGPELSIGRSMPDDSLRQKISLLNRYVQSLCGLYSRVARQLQVDRSYVSRVARGERRSPEIEQALSSEFSRIIDENQSPGTSSLG